MQVSMCQRRGEPDRRRRQCPDHDTESALHNELGPAPANTGNGHLLFLSGCEACKCKWTFHRWFHCLFSLGNYVLITWAGS